jgi:ketosteroid isomerase-like protein
VRQDNPRTMPEESTTPDLVELTRRSIDALNAGDIDAAMGLAASDIVFEGARETLEGHAALRGFFQDRLDAYDELEFGAERRELDEITDWTTTVDGWIDGGSEVIAVLRVAGRGRKRGAPFQRREVHVWTVRDGKLWRLRVYETRAEALRAAGL